MGSKQVWPRLINEPVDFIYIDGNHDYEYVLWDIANAWGLCKTGGVIGGHDYYDHQFGIKRAVDEFRREKKLDLKVDGIDWWFIKKQFAWNA